MEDEEEGGGRGEGIKGIKVELTSSLFDLSQKSSSNCFSDPILTSDRL